MSRKSLFDQFEVVGRDLFASRLISSHGGNLSIRQGDTIYITRTGCQLAHLCKSDIVEVPLIGSSPADEQASCELVVHRAIYQMRQRVFGACDGAIVHAHSSATTIRSLIDDAITPLDSEARFMIGQAPIVTAKTTIGSPEAARLLAEALSSEQPHRAIAVLRGHGPFAYGSMLEDAYRLVSVLEHSSVIINQIQILDQPLR